MLVAAFFVAAIGLARYSGVGWISVGAFQAMRWIAIALLAAYAAVRRSLTAWIFVGLAAGAELGHD